MDIPLMLWGVTGPLRASGLTSQASSLLWGLFCACSWTWCIGMYLPVIMIDRFGWPGFIAFALPNVIGCAAFGYVIRTRARSEAMVAAAGGTMTTFSIITITYHMFFVVWLLADLTPLDAQHPWIPPVVAAITLGLGIVFSFFPDRDWLALGALVYGLSLAAFFGVGLNGIDRVAWSGRMGHTDLLWLTPALIFGFALSPYLDLTFHRAIQRVPSRHAFAVFGLAFAVMLVLTIAIWLPPAPGARWLPSIALAHIMAQTVFTVGAHAREIRLSPAIGGVDRRVWALTAPALGAALPYVGLLFAPESDFGEDLYIRFLVFYGLVFPAYVLLRMACRAPWPILACLIIASLPCYELGFVGGRPWLLALPLGAILITAAAFRTTPSTAPSG
jgi:hypothetical protein